MELFCRTFGSGEPLIILHGLFGQSDNWVSIGKRLAQKFCVFILDQCNHGHSPHAPLHTYRAMTDDLTEFVKTHNLKKINILGHSMGGKTAMCFALENSENVNKLIIADISPRKYEHNATHTRIMNEMTAINLTEYTTRTAIENILQQNIPETHIRMLMLKNLYFKTQGKLAWRINLDAIKNNAEALFNDIVADGVFKNNVLFIRGGKSDYVLDSDIPRIKQLFPNAQIKTIPHASHLIQSDAPDEILRIVEQFLEQQT